MNDTAQVLLRVYLILDDVVVVLLCNDESHVIRLCLVISCQNYPDLARTFLDLDDLQPINSHLPTILSPPFSSPFSTSLPCSHENIS